MNDGLVLSQLTGWRWVRGALRQLAFVAAAAGVTFLVGKLFGTAML